MLRFNQLYLFVILLFCQCCTKTIEDDIIYPSIVEPNESEYIAIFGDIQYCTNSKYIGIYQASINAILNSLNNGARINCVLHTGDVTQDNNPESWKLYYNATRLLADKTLYVSAIGDHDYTWHDDIRITDRNDTHFSEYVSFPKTISKIVAQFETNHMENVVIENKIHGERYDILCLEFGPRKEVVEWANQYVSSHPEVMFILLNHEYLEKGGGRRITGLKCVTRIRNSSYTTPDELWNQLVRRNNNIVCVLCGHVAGLYAVTFEKNDFDRVVPQIQYNIQGPDYRYDNWLMLWEFPNDGDSTSVSIVNTKTLNFFSDSKSLFKFRYRY